MNAAQLERRLLAYSLTAGAAVAGTTVGAAIVHTELDPAEVLTRQLSTTVMYPLDLDNNGTADFMLELEHSSYYGLSAWSSRTFANAVNLTSGGRDASYGNPNPGNPILAGYFASGFFAQALLSGDLISGADASATGWTNGWPHLGRRAVGEYYSSSLGSYVNWGPNRYGPWHGQGPRFMGLAIWLGGELHHGWARCTLADNFGTLTIHDYAYQDEAGLPIMAGDRGNNMAAPGRAMPARAADAGIHGGEFTAAPKIFGVFTDPIKDPDGLKPRKAGAKVLAKPSVTEPAAAVPFDWTRKTRLNDPNLFKAAYKAGTVAAAQPLTQTAMPIDLQLTSKQLADPKTPVDMPDIALLPPVISGVFDEFGDEVMEASPGDQVVVRGVLFGQKPPKVWMEYRVNGVGPVKMLRLKLVKAYANAKGVPLKSIYKYANAAGKLAASVMEPGSGASEITVQIPAKLPKGWDPVAVGDGLGLRIDGHDLVIDNGIGIAHTPFETVAPR